MERGTRSFHHSTCAPPVRFFSFACSYAYRFAVCRFPREQLCSVISLDISVVLFKWLAYCAKPSWQPAVDICLHICDAAIVMSSRKKISICLASVCFFCVSFFVTSGPASNVERRHFQCHIPDLCIRALNPRWMCLGECVWMCVLKRGFGDVRMREIYPTAHPFQRNSTSANREPSSQAHVRSHIIIDKWYLRRNGNWCSIRKWHFYCIAGTCRPYLEEGTKMWKCDIKRLGSGTQTHTRAPRLSDANIRRSETKRRQAALWVDEWCGVCVCVCMWWCGRSRYGSDIIIEKIFIEWIWFRDHRNA